MGRCWVFYSTSSIDRYTCRKNAIKSYEPIYEEKHANANSHTYGEMEMIRYDGELNLVST